LCFLGVFLSIICSGCSCPDHMALGNAGAGTMDEGTWREFFGDSRSEMFNERSGLDDERFRRLVPALQGIRVLDLALDCPGITDASIPSINRLKTLETLALDDSRITPNGVQELTGLPRLSYIQVYGPLWDDESIKETAAKLPGVEIHRDGDWIKDHPSTSTALVP